jgi:hypothetical protein
MTDRERLLKTFGGEVTDRIPVSPFIHINYVKEFYGSHDVDWVTKTPQVYKHFGFEVIHRNCSATYDAYGPLGTGWEIDVQKASEGRDELTTTEIRTPGGTLRIEEVLRWAYEYDAQASAVRYPIQDAEDLDLFVEHQPPADPADVSDIGRAQAAVGEDGIVAPWIQGAFNLVAYYYRRVDDLLMDAMLNPDFYGRMMRHFLGSSVEFVGSWWLR